MLGKRNGSFLEKEMFDLRANSNNKEKQEEEHSRLLEGHHPINSLEHRKELYFQRGGTTEWKANGRK